MVPAEIQILLLKPYGFNDQKNETFLKLFITLNPNK